MALLYFDESMKRLMPTEYFRVINSVDAKVHKNLERDITVYKFTHPDFDDEQPVIATFYKNEVIFKPKLDLRG